MTCFLSHEAMLSQFNNIVMATELNSVHKHSESPLHWSGRKRETIPDYLCCGSHDLRNSGYRYKGSLKNGQNYIINYSSSLVVYIAEVKPKPRSSSFMVATSRDWNHIFSLNSAGRVQPLRGWSRWFESNSENCTGVMELEYILSSKLRFCEFKSRLSHLHTFASVA